jgi:hypothetical protein
VPECTRASGSERIIPAALPGPRNDLEKNTQDLMVADGAAAIIATFSMANPKSLAQNIEMWGDSLPPMQRLES